MHQGGARPVPLSTGWGGWAQLAQQSHAGIAFTLKPRTHSDGRHRSKVNNWGDVDQNTGTCFHVCKTSDQDESNYQHTTSTRVASMELLLLEPRQHAGGQLDSCLIAAHSTVETATRPGADAEGGGCSASPCGTIVPAPKSKECSDGTRKRRHVKQ